jgi:NAD(P)-dependent dehydrogenase (short-subunit alcohol dehydrogenase family)
LIIAIMKGATHEPAAMSSTTSFPLGWAAPTNPGVRAKGSDRVLRISGSRAAAPTVARRLAAQVKGKHGRIDVLFVNAGIAKFAPIELVDEAFYDNQFNVNVKGARSSCSSTRSRSFRTVARSS